VFIVTGMGGGTGSGASPLVAEIAAEQGALVIAFVTLPFSFEGGRRLKQAEEGLRALRGVCDAVIPLPNDVLLQMASDNETVLDSFARADEWIGRGVKSIWSMLFKTGLINLDFATLRQAFSQRGGKTLFSLGEGRGEEAVGDAIRSLKLCPLLHTPDFSRKADRLLVNILGGADLSLPKVNEIMTAITDQFGRDSHIIMGAVIDEDMPGRVEVCVIGTSDMGGRGVPARRPVVAAGRSRPPLPIGPRSESVGAAPVAAGVTKPAEPEAKATSPVKLAQEEFGFGEIESRGHFEKTDRNLFDGQDLDVPTYLRKGIKIVFDR
jgi:cell division protein FtsZ